MDNRVLNINGPLKEHGGDKLLEQALKVAFLQDGWGNEQKCVAWVESVDYGLILLWSDYEGKSNKMLCPVSSAECVPLVQAWLESDFATTVKPSARREDCWDGNADHDGSNGLGWRVYVEDWGHVGNFNAVICAVRPAFMWYGQ